MPVSLDPEVLEECTKEPDRTRDGLNRRSFLTYAAGTAGLAPAIPAAFAGLSQPWESAVQLKPRSRRPTFFNLSHEPDFATAEYYLVAGNFRYRLRGLQSGDAELARERMSNSFLSRVPDQAITHVVQSADLLTQEVAIVYLVKNPDTSSGQWSLSSMYTSIPQTGFVAAYNRARTKRPAGPLPMSAKRKKYGHPPALSLNDMLEERTLFDSTDHAVTLISFHPNLFCGDAENTAHVHSNYIQPNGFTSELSAQIESLGDAQPEVSSGNPNSNGWATLVPIPDETTGQPARNVHGKNAGLIQYFPDWNSNIDPIAAQAATAVAPAVKDDETLGADITGSDGNTQPKGLWARHDGFPTVDQTPGSPRALTGTTKFKLTDESTDQGLLITATVQDGTPLKVTLTCANWYLRWIGIWLQFLKANNQDVILVKDLSINPIPGGDTSSNLDDAVFGAMVPPEFTIFAIPVDAGYSTITFNMPPEASYVRILGSSLGQGSNDYPDEIVLGSVMTIGMNFGVTTIFLIAGASTKTSAFQKTVVLPVVNLLAQELATLLAADLRSKAGISDPSTWKSMGLALGKALANLAARETLRGVVLAIAAIITESTLEDCIPIAGQILRFIAAVVGSADLIHTFTDVLLSPWSYVFSMAFTHDVSMNLKPDQNNNNFPETANYYKVTALFDNGGTPYTQTLPLSGVTSSLPPVVFKDVPLGGNINISTAFYSRSNDPAENDWLAGKGTTGLVSNTVDQAPDLAIMQYKVPIKSSTLYQHNRKTVLLADGSRTWNSTGSAPTAKSSDVPCAGPGTLCDFRNITVRQGTATQQGYVGYGWKGYSANLTGCGTNGAVGQYDQLANLNTGDNAQSGYAAAPCGLKDGARIAYSQLTQSGSNYYLDTTSGLVRQVNLANPQFDSPGNGNAWCKLNFGSDALLLHPNGKLVSINNAESWIETFRVPAQPLPDADAATKYIAQVYGGQGSRPGLIDAPTAAAISPEGVVLILEQNNNRIQAFDTGANPVQYFTKQTRPYFLSLDATASGDTVYLDLAVEFTGYLYVLSYNQSSNVYRLDIYDPGQSDTNPISTTQNFNAAKLTVDYWRNVYALNYELLRLPGGSTPSVAEPSVSMWIPS